MPKLILAALIAALLAACAAPMQAVPQRTAITGFATLASVDTFEWAAAPTWTRLAQLRHNAARALTKREISVSVAKAIQARADVVRSLLDAAAVADKSGYGSKATDHLAWAIAGIEDAEILLKGKP